MSLILLKSKLHTATKQWDTRFQSLFHFSLNLDAQLQPCLTKQNKSIILSNSDTANILEGIPEWKSTTFIDAATLFLVFVIHIMLVSLNMLLDIFQI